MANAVRCPDFFGGRGHLCCWCGCSSARTRGQEVVRRRMRFRAKGGTRGSAELWEASLGTRRTAEQRARPSPFDDAIGAGPRSLNDYVLQAGMKTKPAKVVLFMAVSGLRRILCDVELWLGSFLASLFVALVAGCAPLGVHQLHAQAQARKI